MVRRLPLLVYFLFKDKHGKGVKLTKIQEEIVFNIITLKHDKLCIAAYTGYGKTFVAAISLLLTAIVKPGIRIGCISLSQKQSSICFNYILEFISRQPVFWELLKTKGRTFDQLTKELSREKISIGSSTISILTANKNKKGENLLGFHFDVVLEDEAAEIPEEIERLKIRRMLETSPEDVYKKNHIKISTTHHRGHFKDWVENPKIKSYLIPDIIGIKEGRIDESFLEDQKLSMGDRDYGVWYKCEFPEEDESSFYTDSEIKQLLKPVLLEEAWWKKYEVSLGIDVARFGPNNTVFTVTLHKNGEFYTKVPNITLPNGKTRLAFFPKTSVTDTIRIAKVLIKEYNPKFVIVDAVGIGSGVSDGLREWYKGSKVVVLDFKAGNKPKYDYNKRDYYNVASMCAGWIKKSVNGLVLHYVDNGFIRKDMENVEYEYAGGRRIHINKKGSKYDSEEYSPDFFDSYCMSIYPWVEKTFIKVLDLRGEKKDVLREELKDSFPDFDTTDTFKY